LVSRLKQLTRQQKLAAISMLLATTLGGAALMSYRSAHAPVSLLTTKVDQRDCEEITSVLLRNGIEHQVGPNEDEITVAPQDRSRARFLILKARLPRHTARVAPDSKPFGSSSVEERNRRHHLLEQDIAQTLNQFSGVTEVDVKIAVPETDNALDQIPVTAAVVVHLEDGKQLEPEQVSAVVNFVAASVPQLQQKEVKVIDGGTGRELTTDQSPESEKSQAGRKQCTLEIQKAEDLRAKAQHQLDAVLGQGRSSVVVDCQYDTSEEDTQSHLPSPLGAQVIGRVTISESMATNDTEEKNKNYVKTNDTTKFDPSYVNNHRLSKSPRLQRVTASAAFDNLPPARVKELSAMIEGAVGLDESRGDRLTVSDVPFNRASPLFQSPKSHSEGNATPSNDLGALALAGLAGGLLIVPAVMLWFGARHRGIMTSPSTPSYAMGTSTDLADLLHDKKGTTTQTILETQVREMGPRDMAEALRSKWLAPKDEY
jgi:flagellar M-ring protein FliF